MRIKHFKENIPSISFLLFGLIPLSSQKIETIITLLFVLFLVFNSLFSDSKKGKVGKLQFFFNASLFFILLLTFIDGIDLYTFKKLEQMLSFLVFPITFYFLLKKKNINIDKLINLWKLTFLISTFFLTIFCYYIFYTYSNPKYLHLDVNFFRNSIMDNSYFSRHPIYVSMFLNVAIFIAIDFLLKYEKIKYKIILLIFLASFSVVLFLLSSKMAIISLLFCLLVFFFSYFSKKKFVLAIFGLIIVSSVLFIKVPTSLNRFSELFEKNITSKKNRYNSIFIHKETILCSLKLIKENFTIGVGVENSDKLVNKCVRDTFKYDEEIVYNSHNQYLSFALHSGALGFLLFVSVILNALLNSFKSNKFLFILVLYFSITFFSENILERQSGLLLFSFILNIIPSIRNFEAHKKILN